MASFSANFEDNEEADIRLSQQLEQRTQQNPNPSEENEELDYEDGDRTIVASESSQTAHSSPASSSTSSPAPELRRLFAGLSRTASPASHPHRLSSPYNPAPQHRQSNRSTPRPSPLNPTLALPAPSFATTQPSPTMADPQMAADLQALRTQLW